MNKRKISCFLLTALSINILTTNVVSAFAQDKTVVATQKQVVNEARLSASELEDACYDALAKFKFTDTTTSDEISSYIESSLSDEDVKVSVEMSKEIKADLMFIELNITLDRDGETIPAYYKIGFCPGYDKVPDINDVLPPVVNPPVQDSDSNNTGGNKPSGDSSNQQTTKRITNLKATSEDNSVTLTWTNPTDSDFKEVWVFRDNTKVATVTDDTYTDEGLYSNWGYKYSVYPVMKSGDTPSAVSCFIGTKSKDVNFMYCDNNINSSYAFDSNLDTYDVLNSKKVIKWNGNLAGKSIQIKTSGNEDGVKITMKDSSGKEIGFYSFEYKDYISSLTDIEGGVYNFVVPENAAYIELDSQSTYNLYEVGLSDLKFDEDSCLKNISTTAVQNAIAFKWDNPTNADFKEIDIIRDEAVIGTVNTPYFVDTELSPNTKYNYALVVRNNSNEAIYSTNLSVSTKSKGDGLLFSGISGAIDGVYSQDGNLETYESSKGYLGLTSADKMDNAKVNISLSSNSDVKIKVKNSENKYVKFFDESTKEYVSELNYKSVRAGNHIQTFEITLPTGTSLIELSSVDGSNINLHNIKQVGVVSSDKEIKDKINTTLKSLSITSSTKDSYVLDAVKKSLVNERANVSVSLTKDNATNPTKIDVVVKVVRGDEVISVKYTVKVEPVQKPQTNTNNTTNSTNATTTKAKIITCSVNMRSNADFKSKVLETIKVGQTVEYISKSGDFAKIKYNGKTGYVMAKYVQKVTTSNGTTSSGGASNTATNSTKGEVTASSLNVRSGAGTKYSVVTKVKKGDKVTILETKNGWYKIKTSNGKTGWVSSSYIKKTTTTSNSSPTTNNATTTNKTTTGTVLPTSLNLRSGTGSKYTVITKVKKGDKVTILETKNGWYKVKASNGKTGWVQTKNIKKASTNKTVTGTVTASTLNVRSGAGTKYKVVTKVKKGNKVTILETKNGWYKIKTSNGKTGWVQTKYIKK